jgi:uncharacterized repeat protein (TIGR04044 family)
MPKVTKPANMKGEFLVDYEEKVFEDVKADPGEKALVTFHTVAFEGSIGLVNLLQATRLQRKGFETSVLLYGPGVTLGLKRGFPTLGDEAFPGAQNFGNQIAKFIAEGGKVYAARSARSTCSTSCCCTARPARSSSTPGRCKRNAEASPCPQLELSGPQPSRSRRTSRAWTAR